MSDPLAAHLSSLRLNQNRSGEEGGQRVQENFVCLVIRVTSLTMNKGHFSFFFSPILYSFQIGILDQFWGD